MTRWTRWTRWGLCWDEFWFAEAPTLNLAIFRGLFSLCLFREVGTSLVKSRFAIEGGFHMPYLSWIPRVSEDLYAWLHLLQYPLIVLLGLGVLHRAAAASLVVLQGWIFFADGLNFRNHPYFFLLVLLLLVFAPASESLSFEAFRRIRLAQRSKRIAGTGVVWHAFVGRNRPLIWQRLIQVQTALVYFYAALHKIHVAYLGGDVLDHQLNMSATVRSCAQLGRWIGLEAGTFHAWLTSPPVLATMAWGTLLVELGLALLLWPRRTRRWAMAIGVLFHLSIAWLMNIQTFSWAMIATYLLFAAPHGLCDRLQSWLGIESSGDSD